MSGAKCLVSNTGVCETCARGYFLVNNSGKLETTCTKMPFPLCEEMNDDNLTCKTCVETRAGIMVKKETGFWDVSTTGDSPTN